jgi:hypothetical protein
LPPRKPDFVPFTGTLKATPPNGIIKVLYFYY